MADHQNTIPIIDLFAGPGGLGEGFCAFKPRETTHEQRFKIRLSIEKDPDAHDTLLLRTFFRQFGTGGVPDDYYQYIRGEIDRDTLFNAHPSESRTAVEIAWQATLGKIRRDKLRSRISKAVGDAKKWVLIGGPPCQAYSLVGRSRVGKENENDSRHGLYRHYLRIIAEHQPPVFVMENVRGLLSARRKGRQVFERMRKDLEHPAHALRLGSGPKYVLCGLDAGAHELFENGDGFLLRCEDFGIPQARHRVIIVGIREDVGIRPKSIGHEHARVHVGDVLYGLPALRSRLSTGPDDEGRWQREIREGLSQNLVRITDAPLRATLKHALAALRDGDTGSQFVRASDVSPAKLADWLFDPRIGGACNHEARGHMREDLCRYLYATCFAEVKGRSPSLDDLPQELLPSHRNVALSAATRPFNDRFRVQRRDAPATTVTAHISKDGHYYIHHDPAQCRSWTVREAARIQTFPDNYYFEGPRTSQFQQVGNAVPPLLAYRIAARVFALLREWDHGQAQQGAPKLEHEPNSEQGNRSRTQSPPSSEEAPAALSVAAKAAGHARLRVD